MKAETDKNVRQLQSEMEYKLALALARIEWAIIRYKIKIDSAFVYQTTCSQQVNPNL